MTVYQAEPRDIVNTRAEGQVADGPRNLIATSVEETSMDVIQLLIDFMAPQKKSTTYDLINVSIYRIVQSGKIDLCIGRQRSNPANSTNFMNFLTPALYIKRRSLTQLHSSSKTVSLTVCMPHQYKPIFSKK